MLQSTRIYRIQAYEYILQSTHTWYTVLSNILNTGLIYIIVLYLDTGTRTRTAAKCTLVPGYSIAAILNLLLKVLESIT